MEPVAEKTYTLGRHPDNTVCINKPQVSGHHATLTVVSENTMLLEDHDSTNGTFVNGTQVQRTLIGPDDKVLFGNVPVVLEKLFARNRSSVTPPAATAAKSDYSTEFLILKDVYETYQQARHSLQQREKIKAVARAGLVFIPHVGPALGILMMGMLTSTEQYAVLDREFQIKYVCPKCRRYLGSLVWDTLANQKRCGCGAVWVND